VSPSSPTLKKSFATRSTCSLAARSQSTPIDARGLTIAPRLRCLHHPQLQPRPRPHDAGPEQIFQRHHRRARHHEPDGRSPPAAARSTTPTASPRQSPPPSTMARTSTLSPTLRPIPPAMESSARSKSSWARDGVKTRLPPRLLRRRPGQSFSLHPMASLRNPATPTLLSPPAPPALSKPCAPP